MKTAPCKQCGSVREPRVKLRCWRVPGTSAIRQAQVPECRDCGLFTLPRRGQRGRHDRYR